MDLFEGSYISKWSMCSSMKFMHIGIVIFMEFMPIEFIVIYVASGMHFIRWYEQYVLIIKNPNTRHEVLKFVSKLVKNGCGALH